MTSWDAHALANDQVEDFLQEIQDEYEDAGADSDVETVVTALECHGAGRRRGDCTKAGGAW